MIHLPSTLHVLHCCFHLFQYNIWNWAFQLYMLNKVPPLVFHVHQLFHVILPDFLKFLLSLSTLSFRNWHLKHHISLLLFALQSSKIDNRHYWTLFSPMLVHRHSYNCFHILFDFTLLSSISFVVNSFTDSKQTLYSIHCNSNIITGRPGFWMSHFTLVYPDASPATVKRLIFKSSHPSFSWLEPHAFNFISTVLSCFRPFFYTFPLSSGGGPSPKGDVNQQPLSQE